MVAEHNFGRGPTPARNTPSEQIFLFLCLGFHHGPFATLTNPSIFVILAVYWKLCSIYVFVHSRCFRRRRNWAPDGRGFNLLWSMKVLQTCHMDSLACTRPRVLVLAWSLLGFL